MIKFSNHVVNFSRSGNEVNLITLLDESISFRRDHFSVSIKGSNPDFFISQMIMQMADGLIYEKAMLFGFNPYHLNFSVGKIKDLESAWMLNDFGNIICDQFFWAEYVFDRYVAL